MKLNRLNEVIFDTDDIVNGLYSGKIKKLSDLNISNSKLIKQFNQGVEENADDIETIKEYVEPNISLEEFDQLNQQQWLIPTDYCPNLVEYLFDCCKTSEQKDRVALELELFIQHDMLEVLHALKYLVDFMRSENIVWGLGRGSSVASYCLYLIGIHKVDSLKYQLDINEFLKGEKNV
jgi:DNA polymerase III alpha subunit